jgi:hypothetical protein
MLQNPVLFEGLTAANSAPSGDAGIPWDKSPRGLFTLRSVAGSGTVAIAVKMWGRVPRATNAYGTITCDAKAAYSGDNGLAMAVISDGVTSVSFNCSYAGAAVTGVKVDISGASTDGSVAALLVAAINGRQGQDFRIRAVARSGASDHIIDIYNIGMNGTTGNVTVTEACAAGAHAVTGMTGAVNSYWVPLGTDATAALKGVINEKSLIGETSTDAVVHCEWISGLQKFDRLYAEADAVNGTFEAYILEDSVVR